MTDNESMQSTAPSGSGVAGYESTQSTTVSGSAAAGYVFAGVILILVGCFQAVVGLAAIFDDEFFVVSKNYTFEIDTTAWGWIHLHPGAGPRARGLRALRCEDVGARRRRDSCDAERDRELLLHPVLSVLGDPDHRAGRVGDLGIDTVD